MADQLECSSNTYLLTDPVNIGVDCMESACDSLTLTSQMVASECLSVAEKVNLRELNDLIESLNVACTTMVWECASVVQCCKHQNLECSEIMRVSDSFFSVKDAMKVFVRAIEFYDETLVGVLIATFMDLEKKIKMFEIILQFIITQLEF
jgi:hypothetical protein